jgi:hypothetical protein
MEGKRLAIIGEEKKGQLVSFISFPIPFSRKQ